MTIIYRHSAFALLAIPVGAVHFLNKKIAYLLAGGLSRWIRQSIGLNVDQNALSNKVRLGEYPA